MDYQSLEHFLRKKMRLTHIYQPIMIRTLLQNDDTASTEEIAREFLNHDESQLKYYKNITKRWPHRTLKAHNVISYRKDRYTLLLDEVTDGQRRRLIELCNLRLEEFIDRDPWIRTFRELDARSISGSVRYDVLARSRGVCAACGSKPPGGLHVDHIMPRSLGGKTELDNLQTLCYRCNQGKRNRDDTDFMREWKRLQYRKKGCSMCAPKGAIMCNNLAHAVYADSDIKLHSLIRPNRHVGSFMEMIPAEKSLCVALAEGVMNHIESRDRSVKEFDVRFDEPSSHYAINVIPIR